MITHQQYSPLIHCNICSYITIPTISFNIVNLLPVIGLVNRSARFELPGTYATTTSHSSMYSLIKWYLLLICLILR